MPLACLKCKIYHECARLYPSPGIPPCAQSFNEENSNSTQQGTTEICEWLDEGNTYKSTCGHTIAHFGSKFEGYLYCPYCSRKRSLVS